MPNRRRRALTILSALFLIAAGVPAPAASLDYVGTFVWTGDDDSFGGFSGIEISPDGTDHGAETFRWEVLVRCGDPSKPAVQASFSALTTENGWFGMPDNCTFDGSGRLWIATDGNNRRATGRADGIWGTERVINGQGKHEIRIPTCIENGDYLLRAEMLALHAAGSYPGAQFYQECAQVRISGGTGAKKPSTVSFPGAYKVC